MSNYIHSQNTESPLEQYELMRAYRDEKIETPLASVNYHLIKACNYACKFCFARFSQGSRFLPLTEAKKLVRLLRSHGTQKITFVGGEPFLYLKLGALIRYTKSLSITTMIVTNGSLLDPSFLVSYGKYIDWIGFSIDSGIPATENSLGRKPKNCKTQKQTHVQRVRSLVPLVRAFGIQIKINTVITSLNWDENMNRLIEELNPDRWKVFQVLRIEGENDGAVEPLLITPEQFQHFIDFHQKHNPVAESNNAMTGSYVMIDPSGRFFDNIAGFFSYGRPILEVGVEQAFEDVQFSIEKFYQRGGHYHWAKQSVKR